MSLQDDTTENQQFDMHLPWMLNINNNDNHFIASFSSCSYTVKSNHLLIFGACVNFHVFSVYFRNTYYHSNIVLLYILNVSVYMCMGRMYEYKIHKVFCQHFGGGFNNTRRRNKTTKI